MIFERTASEIEYPSTYNYHQHHEEPTEELNEAVSVEILDGFPARDSTNKTDTTDIMEIESDVSVGSLGKFDVLLITQNSEEKRTSALPEPVKKRRKVGDSERPEAFNPKKPFFRVKMGSSYHSGRRMVSSFALNND